MDPGTPLMTTPADKTPDEITDSRWHPEVELKLRADGEALERLLQVPPLAFAQGVEAAPRDLESVYFDTAGRGLQKAGMILRVRRDGDRYVQTLKSDAPGSQAHARLERHDPVEGFRARAAVLREEGGVRLEAIADGDLLSLFATRVARRKVLVSLRGGASTIEVALDRGTIESGTRSLPVAEVELELRDGALADLYDLALTLHRLEPLAIEARTKSERGFELAGGMPPPWRKPRALKPNPATSLEHGIAAVLGQCFDHWIGNQAAALDGSDIEGVHQMRVALRRLRAALVFFAPWLPPQQAAWMQKEARWLARKLGAVRDLDVLIDHTLAPPRKARPGDRDLKALAGVLREAQGEVHDELRMAIGSTRYTTFVLTAGQWIAGGGWRGNAALDRPLGVEARSALDASLAAVLAEGEGFDELDAPARHALRLQIKKLRYALQFVGGAYGGAKPLLRLTERLQDALGEANDAVLSEALIEKTVRGRVDGGDRRRIAKATGIVVGWWLARTGSREQELRALWREMVELPPFWRAERPQLMVVEGTASPA